MSKAIRFTENTKRNALRRESGLPLLDIRVEMQKAEEIDKQKEFAEICRQNQAIREQIEERVRSELAERGFDCLSAGGRVLLNATVQREFLNFLRGLGVVVPKPSGTTYGGARKDHS